MILYAVNVTDCNELIDKAFRTEQIKRHPRLSKQLESLTRRKSEHYLSRGHNTNNLMEVFNPNVLAESVIKVLDKHHQRRIQNEF